MAIILGNESEFLSVDGAFYISTDALDSTKFVVVYQDTNDSNHGTAKIGTVSGVDITFGAEKEFLDRDAATYSTVAKLSESGFVVAYRDSAGVDQGVARIGTVSGTTISFGPKKEFMDEPYDDGVATYVYQDALDAEFLPTEPNQGSTNQLWVWWNSSSNNIQRFYLEFDISNISSGEIIQSAKLELDCWSAATSAYAIKVRRVTQSGITESGVTWTEYDTGFGWASSGGDYSTEDEIDVTLPTSTGWFTVSGLKDLVIDAIQNRSSRLILIFTGASGTATSDGAGFRSNEYSPGSQAPKLTIVTGFQPEKTTYTQTDTVAGCGAIAGCSSLAIATGASARKAIKNGTPGTGTNTATIPKQETRAAFMFEITPAHATAWTAGQWSLRWKTGATIQGGASITWDETWICRVNSSCNSQATIASITGQAISLSPNTTYGVSITGAQQVHASGDKIYIIIGIKNTNAIDGYDVTMVPSVDIETPILSLSETSWLSPSDVGSELTGGATPEDDWTFGTNIKSSNNVRARTTTVTDKEDMGTFGLSLPSGATVYGFEVMAEGVADGDQSMAESAELGMRLSDDAGSGYTARIDQIFPSDDTSPYPDIFKTYGSPDNDWGHGQWSSDEVTDANFRCRMEFTADSDGGDFGTARSSIYGIDHVKLRAFYYYVPPTTPVPSYISIAALSESGFIVAYRDDGDSFHGTAKIGTVSGTNITFGNETEFLSSGEASYISVAMLSESGFIVAYRDGADSDHGTAKVGTVSGTTITFGDETEFLSAGAANHISVAMISTTKFVVVYRDDADSYHGTARIGTVSGTTITFGDEQEFLAADSADYNSVAVLDESQFVVAYRDNADSGHGTLKIGTVNGTTTTFDDEVEFLSTGSAIYNFITTLDSSKFVVAYQDQSDSNHGTAMVGTIPISLDASGDLFISGAIGVEATGYTASGDLYLQGYEQIINSGNLFINGHVSSSGSINLFIDGYTEVSISGDLYIEGYKDFSTSGDLFIKGYIISIASSNLFIAGQDTIETSGDLFIGGTIETSGVIAPPLFIYGYDTLSISGNLFIQGHSDVAISGDLFIDGYDGTITSGDLFIHGHTDVVASGDLFIGGIEGEEGIPSPSLFIHGNDIIITSGDLFIDGRDQTEISGELFVRGQDSIETSGDLFIDGFIETSGVPFPSLFIYGYDVIQTSGDLFIKGYAEVEVSGDLFIYGQNEIEASGDLFIEGLSTIPTITSGTLFIHGYDEVTISGDLFIRGLDLITASGDLFIDGIITTSSSGDLFIHGYDVFSASNDLFIYGDEDIATSGDLFIDGYDTPIVSGDLFIHGQDSLATSGDLFVQGLILISGTIPLSISGSGIIPINNTATLFINGIISREPVSCPILDPEVAIQISDRIITLYQSHIDALINQLGKNTVLNMPPQRVSCPNCQQEIWRKRSIGVYKIGGPRPFTRGRKCPYCYGKGFLETPVQKCIKCLVKWNPRDFENYNISIQNRDAIVRLKTYLIHIGDLLKAETAIIEYDQTEVVKLQVRRIRDAIPIGLREDRYCVSFWELI